MRATSKAVEPHALDFAQALGVQSIGPMSIVEVDLIAGARAKRTGQGAPQVDPVAIQLASMTLSETPAVVQLLRWSDHSINTRTFEAVP